MDKQNRKEIERDEQIYELGTLVAGDFSLQEVLDKLSAAAVKIVGVKACSIRLLDEETGDLEMRSTYGLSEEYRNKGVVSKDDPVIKAAFAGEAVILDDMRADDRVRFKEATANEGLVSQLTVAMKFRKKVIGVLRLYSPKPKQFSERDITLARAVASQCAAAITNAKLYAEAIEGARITEQVRLAGVIQRRMIPEEAPDVPGLDIAATYIPCFDVGGDFYDFYRTGPSSIAIVIADVMGKGIPAAIMMSMFRGAMRAYADIECGKDTIRTIIDKLSNIASRECRDGEFISLFYSVIDTKKMTLTYCNCGHEPTVLIRDGNVIRLENGGMVLGVGQGTDYNVDTIELKKGDGLLFYTDGVVDAASFEGEFWGTVRMIELARKFIKDPADQMIKNILAYRRRFVGLARQIDDTSLVVVKVGTK